MRNIGSELEVIVLNSDDAIHAQEFGADRLELIKEFDKGGLTPTFETIKNVTTKVKIPVFVMLRNLWDSYVYDKEEFKILLQQLEVIKLTKATGIVFGSLNLDGTINEEQLAIIIATKGKLQLTFHRAIDSVVDYEQGIKTLSQFREIDYVLTSGHAEKAIDGMSNLTLASKILKEKIIVGSGVNDKNCSKFLQIENIKKLHSGTAVRINQDIFNELNGEEIKIIKKSISKKEC